MTSAAPGRAGWHPDPTGRFGHRYWDGNNWTSAVKHGDQVESDPESVPPPPPASRPDTGQSAGPPDWPRRATGDRHTSLPLAEAQDEVVRVLPLAGITVRSQQPGLVQAAVPVSSETNVALAIILCLLCIIPGIIYVIASSRTRMLPAAVYLAQSASGTTAITIQAAPEPRQALLSALATLP